MASLLPLSLLLLLPAITASTGNGELTFLVEAGLPSREDEVLAAIPALEGFAAAEHQSGLHAVPAPVRSTPAVHYPVTGFPVPFAAKLHHNHDPKVVGEIVSFSYRYTLVAKESERLDTHRPFHETTVKSKPRQGFKVDTWFHIEEIVLVHVPCKLVCLWAAYFHPGISETGGCSFPVAHIGVTKYDLIVVRVSWPGDCR